MGMSIDEIIDDLTELKIRGVVPFTKGSLSGGNYRVITGDCLDVAISIMHKYKKIEEICKRNEYPEYLFRDISEVIEDGTD